MSKYNETKERDMGKMTPGRYAELSVGYSDTLRELNKRRALRRTSSGKHYWVSPDLAVSLMLENLESETSKDVTEMPEIVDSESKLVRVSTALLSLYFIDSELMAIQKSAKRRADILLNTIPDATRGLEIVLHLDDQNGQSFRVMAV